ncbi:DUF3833 domain-containing protein [Aliiroseovarius sp. F20344]|uniref:DUF3833 domain-containing protein n=1 Tax=Aliiroseovarius sp. F20344 TaxID=2926414 RepID=UPI001FF64BE4|nr:DUF3833 domain-containing protein [Aliiroseovarius sp. F20344]MCK0141093.1 DUF3833 domain-containing protein [Aliiroseovarius sp. F20344]
MKLLTILPLLVLLVMFAKSLFLSFRAQSPGDYASTDPAFALKTHLSGPILSEGLIYGPTGKVTNSFVAKMVGEWDGDTGTLSEDFTYSNGKQQSRKWFLKMGEGNTFTATADDIIGEARGIVSGSTIKMEYTIVLPEEAGGHSLSVTDWLYLTENGVIMNKSEMRKFGIKVAELIATMRPDGVAQQ